MSSAQSLTQKWLRHNVQPYPNPDRVFTDIYLLLPRYPTLRPKSDIYSFVLLPRLRPSLTPQTAFDDGRTQLLLCVHGVLPISFRGAPYNIPIAIWLTREYPNQPPIAYVVPTNDMLVKSGKYLDVSGRCNIEYIQNWARKSEGCSLSALVEAMQVQFSTEPPVYAKPSQTVAPATVSRPLSVVDPRDRPPPPLPSSQPVPPQRPISPDRPALPPRPVAAAIQSPLEVPVRSQERPATHEAMPERPPPPPRSDPLPPQYRGYYTGPTTPPIYTIPIGSSTPVLDNTHTQHNSQSSGIRHTSLSASPPPANHAIDPQTRFQPISSEHPFAQPIRAPIVSLLDEDSPDTLLNAPPAFAPPPPRPPNPELLRLHHQVHQKLTSELSSLSQALALDAERLRAHQTDLLAGEPAIRDEMARLEAVRDVCRNVARRLKDSVQQAETNIAELRRKGDPEVDELICSTTIVHNQ
ncbi:hypothetical protein C0995_005101 [Termitomyces sp. Mi166|nr:hypothetical protein C0995_005101 [Termitomyces sp. Mi166\